MPPQPMTGSPHIDIIRTRLESRAPQTLDDPILIPASVLIPVFDLDGRTRILFTRRARGLAKHAGEVSFPGGRQDPGDRGPVEAALRETREELGIDSGKVVVLGALDPISTVTNYRVQPFVGEIPWPVEFQMSEGEVGSVFDIAVEELLDPGIYTLHREHVWKGRPYPVHQFRVAGENIWGATGKILAQFLHVVYGWGDAETVMAGRS
ncbi:MAG: CoA pyrophosphatase [Deltaproteobacteria bacterium]|nr:CoA pyrophosphatase [Deltaproteobacteria bacterium]